MWLKNQILLAIYLQSALKSKSASTYESTILAFSMKGIGNKFFQSVIV